MVILIDPSLERNVNQSLTLTYLTYLALSTAAEAVSGMVSNVLLRPDP